MSKSWAYGAAVVALVHTAWFGLIFLGSRADWFMAPILVMEVVVLNVAGLGAFVTAMTAQRHGFPLGLSMAPVNAFLAVVSNLLFAVMGIRVDLSGFYGNLGLFIILLAYGIFVSAIGGGIGLWMRRRNGKGVAPVSVDPPAAAPAARIEPYISDPGAPN
jgi:hypothetical protein